MNMVLNELKSEIFSSLEMKLSAIISTKPFYSYNQTSAYLIKWTLLKSPEKYYHASQFTKHVPSMTLKGNTLLKIQKWWDSILSAFC